MQVSVFEGIASDSLRGYAVWEPILRTDDLRGARKATTVLPDPRVHHYWTNGRTVGEMFQAPLGLEDRVAWDVYLVYPPGVEWKGDTPPRPEYFMHQLPSLPQELRLEADTLAARVRAVLTR